MNVSAKNHEIIACTCLKKQFPISPRRNFYVIQIPSVNFWKSKFRTIFATNYFCKGQNKTSKYTGVSWKKDKKKWQAQLKHERNNYFGGYFDDEEQAAMSVNLLCDKYGIERKHPMISIDLDAIQKVIPLLFIMYEKRSKHFFGLQSLQVFLG